MPLRIHAKDRICRFQGRPKPSLLQTAHHQLLVWFAFTPRIISGIIVHHFCNYGDTEALVTLSAQMMLVPTRI